MVFIPGGGRRESRTIDREATKLGLGVWPEQVPDYKGLAGDASDNIPGVKGVGPKTAAQLIEDFGSVEELYSFIEAKTGREADTRGTQGKKEVKIAPKVVEKLVRDKEQALLSKELSTIKTDVPLSFALEACLLSAYDKDRALAVLIKYGFKSLIPALPVDQFEAAVQDALF
jgi:DNA polymerase-1